VPDARYPGEVGDRHTLLGEPCAQFHAALVTETVTKVNTSVTDFGHRIGYNSPMPGTKQLTTTPLHIALAVRGISQQELADLIGTSKQQVNKLVHGTVKMSAEWARKISPHVMVPWTVLLGEGSIHVPGDHDLELGRPDLGVGANAPFNGNLVDQATYKELLSIWVELDPDVRLAILTLIKKLPRTSKLEVGEPDYGSHQSDSPERAERKARRKRA
jgi:transcriptional regulator with XRE-family HTH domain